MQAENNGDSGKIKILSCNIRTSHAKRDGANHWDNRREFCASYIGAQKPDLIGFQEMMVTQHAYLTEAMPEFTCHALIDEPEGGVPADGIFFRKERFDLISAGGYWLSETPHISGTRSWDSDCIRMANWVMLRDRVSGKIFRFVNTHLDHISQLAREKQAAMLVEDAQAFPADYPQILSGDFNCDIKNPALQSLFKGGWHDSYAAAHGNGYPGFTFHAFEGVNHKTAQGNIDWIFTRGKIAVHRAEVLKEAENGRYPSDHFFIGATFSLV